MREELISMANQIRSILSAIAWAIVGAAIFVPLTLLAGSFYAIVCAVLYGKVVLWGEIALHWGLLGIAAGGLLGFPGRLMDGKNPLASEPIRRSLRPPTFAAIA